MTYSVDFREKVLSVKAREKLSFSAVAERFDVGIASVVRWSKKLYPQRHRNKLPTKISDDSLLQDVAQYPDGYHHERAQRLGCSKSGIGVALKRLNITYKKTLTHPKARPEERKRFEERIASYKSDGHAVVYIDESGFAHDMPRRHGYAVKGLRCYGSHDWGSHGRVNVIGALLGWRLLAVSLFDGSIDSETFITWLETQLLPKLPRGTVIVMDNASFHKKLSMKIMIQKQGHILEYLPTYSPDLNPIEKKWAQAKSIRRKQRCDTYTLFQSFIN